MFALRTAAARAMPALAMRAIAAPRAILSPAMLTRVGSVPVTRAFSNTPLTWNKTDKALITALEGEIKHEEEEGEEVPEYVTSYLKSTPFDITDKVGSDEVILTRKFGNEDIKIVFSVSDINSADDEDVELNEEFEDDDNNQNQDISASGDDEANEEDSDLETLTFPVRCLITISKPGNSGSISIDAIAQDGNFIIESISNIKDSALAKSTTAEADWEKRGLYSGPPFAELDENLQISIEKFLEERAIDTNLANFVPLYVFQKDTTEYMHWLQDFKAFVVAK
ncbi:Mitochondrial acidic protein mam33 [Gryganskiella cystojenkinii]|nr:Mitochondrial acidic protein mam33 [Gryganskiella cystojenkinii]